MNEIYAGSLVALSRADIETAARAYDVDAALLAAFMQVESAWRPNGRPYGFKQDRTIVRRFEKHKFSKHLTPSQRKVAKAQNLITRRYTKGQRGGAREFAAAWNINKKATILASSFGLTQIMGSNFAEAGFEGPYEFLNFMIRSEKHQLDVTMRLMDKWGIIQEMQEGDYRGMARIWNGPAYHLNEYDVKLRRAHRRFKAAFSGIRSDIPAERKNIYSVGDRGKQIKLIQGVLGVKVDGDFGPATLRAMKAFQIDHGLKPDGIAGPKTLAVLNRLIQEKSK